jgi:hypothetical protein
LANDSKNILYTECTLLGNESQNVRVVVDLVMTCNLQEAKQFEFLYDQLREAGPLQIAWRKWGKGVGLVCRTVMIAKRGGGRIKQEDDFVLVVRSKYVQGDHEQSIECGIPAFLKRDVHDVELVTWANRQMSLLKEKHPRSGSFQAKQFETLFEMYSMQTCHEH